MLGFSRVRIIMLIIIVPKCIRGYESPDVGALIDVNVTPEKSGKFATEAIGDVVSLVGRPLSSAPLLSDENDDNLTTKTNTYSSKRKGRRRYDEWKVVRAVPTTPLQLLTLNAMTFDVDLDFWSLPWVVFSPVDIFVGPSGYERLRKRLRENVSSITSPI
jgi:hypothetical protein